ncbi:hypothetical protein ACHAXT_010064 [Thalassiosira profunda]
MKRLCCPAAALLVSMVLREVQCYSCNRRRAFAIVCSTCTVPFVAHAEEPIADPDVQLLTEATEVLSSLLENWDKATIDCTYADVPRELLETKNKEKLLEKASEFALFDKSTSVVSCRKTNKIVRDYIGVTGKGPLVGAEKKLLRKNVVQKVDPDSLDDYFAAAESFSQDLSRANSFSYQAGSDFDSINTFAKEEIPERSSNSNLEQARRAIVNANDSLKKALSYVNS